MSYMPQKTVDVEPGEYAAFVRVIDYSSGDMAPKETYWVKPTRVYRGGKGRQSIEFEHNGETKELLLDTARRASGLDTSVSEEKA